MKLVLPGPVLSDYSFVPANNPTNSRHGGVIVRDDLSFNESKVIELNIYFHLASKPCF